MASNWTEKNSLANTIIDSKIGKFEIVNEYIDTSNPIVHEIKGVYLRDLKTGRNYFAKVSFVVSGIQDSLQAYHMAACYESKINQVLIGKRHLDVADAICTTLEVKDAAASKIFRRFKFTGSKIYKGKFASISQAHVFIHPTILMDPQNYNFCKQVMTLGEFVGSNIDKVTDYLPRILVQAIKAVQTLHLLGIYHNDLHPFNVMVFFSVSNNVNVRLFDYDCSYSTMHVYDFHDSRQGVQKHNMNVKVNDEFCEKQGLCPDNHSRADIYRLLRSLNDAFQKKGRPLPPNFSTFLNRAFKGNTFHDEPNEKGRLQTIVKSPAGISLAYENFIGYACDIKDRSKCRPLSEEWAAKIVLSMDEMLNDIYLKEFKDTDLPEIALRPACVFT